MKGEVKKPNGTSRPSATRHRPQSERRRTEEELQRLNAELSRQAAHLREVNQTLLDSERRLRLAIETGRIGLWVWNWTDLKNVGDWSTQLKEIFGLPLDAEVTHDMFLKCVHPEDRERVDQLVRQALAGANGGEYRAEYRTIHPRDGSEHWVTARGQAFFDSAGEAIRFIGTVMDLTERKRAEESSIRLNFELEQRIAERTEALRTSEDLARGQLEAMTTTLAALSRESEPEKFLEHILRTIGGRLSADSLGVWEMIADTGRAQLVANFEDDRLHLATEGEINASQQAELAPQDHPVWTQFFRNGEHCVFCEIDAAPPRVRVTNGSDTRWHHWFDDGESDPIAQIMMKRLSALGIVAVLCLPMFVGGKVTGLISVRFRHKRAFAGGERLPGQTKFGCSSLMIM